MRPLVAGLVAAAVLAGCTSSPSPAPGASAPHAPGPGGWTLDCALGGFAKAWDANWGQACEARGSRTAGSKTEMWLSINPANPANVVVGSKDLDPETSDHCVWNGLAVTHDGGKTWKDVTIGGKFADRKPDSPFYGYQCNTDPDFRFDAKGDVHYGVEMYNPEGIAPPVGPIVQLPPPLNGTSSGGFKILLATSHDGGDTWPDVVTFQPDFSFTTDYSRMTIVPTTQTILEAIGSDGGVGCHVLRSGDGGKTADTFAVAASPYGGPSCGSGGDTAIAASPKGTAVLIGGIVEQTGTTQVVRSTDDGKTWTDSNQGFAWQQPRGDNAAYRETPTIELAYDLTHGPAAGTLYACYPDGGRDIGDIVVRSSKDDGKTWGDAVRVNDDASGPFQWMCNLAVAGDGSVHVFWMDKRYDPDHKLIDMAHAVSVDGGKTWTNERVSTVSFDGAKGVHQDGFPFIGDYLGVDAVGDHVWAGFPDSSEGDVPVIAAAHVHRAGNTTG